MINWKVRIRNINFWIAIIPASLLLSQTICNLFGIQLNVTEIQDKLLDIVKSVFLILAILGIVADPTTEGIRDSKLAMKYEVPKTKEGYTTIAEIALMKFKKDKSKKTSK